MSEPRTIKGRATAIDRRIGQWLKNQRIVLGMTQQQMGDTLGVTYQQLCKYEKGINRLSAARLLQILAIVGVDLAEFVAEVTAGEPEPQLAGRPNRRAHLAFAGLTPAQQSGFFALMGGEQANGL